MNSVTKLPLNKSAPPKLNSKQPSPSEMSRALQNLAMQRQASRKAPVASMTEYESLIQFIVYFGMLTVVNTVVLSLYALQVFNDHKPCTTRSGKNITIGFEYLFKVGFVLQIIDSCSSLLGLFVRAITYVH